MKEEEDTWMTRRALAVRCVEREVELSVEVLSSTPRIKSCNCRASTTLRVRSTASISCLLDLITPSNLPTYVFVEEDTCVCESVWIRPSNIPTYIYAYMYIDRSIDT